MAYKNGDTYPKYMSPFFKRDSPLRGKSLLRQSLTLEGDLVELSRFEKLVERGELV